MDTDSIPRSCFFIVLLILAGGFFSGSETAYSNCSRVRLKTWADDGNKGAQRALRILDKFDKAIITLLIGTNAIHIVASALAAVLMIRLMGAVRGPLLATLVMTILVFIFSEMIPKSIGKANADVFACSVSWILYALMILLSPLAWLFMGMSRILKLLFRGPDEGPAMTEDDFQSMIETIEDKGGLEADESELIHSAVKFSDRTVAEILTPRVHMVGIDIEDSHAANRELILEEKYSRLPVYKDSLDHIIGILNTKLYLQQAVAQPNRRINIRALMSKPYFIRPDMKLHTLVDEMRRRKMHLAIVQDKWGGTMGMVTLEDLLEELVGDIWDEDEKKTAEAARKAAEKAAAGNSALKTKEEDR